MRIDVDGGRFLYVIGAVFGIAAVLYFARDIVFDLSITVRAALLCLVFVVSLVAAATATRPRFGMLFSLLSAASYLAFLWYTLSRFDVGADGTFLALVLSAALFLSLGYLRYERELSPSPRATRYVVVAVAVLGVVLVGADIAASGVTYDVTIHDEAAVAEDSAVEIGTVTVENRFLFREPIDMPDPTACLYVSGIDEYDMRPQPVQYRVDGSFVPDSLGGGDALEATMTVRMNDEERAAVGGSIPIGTAEECPDTADDERIVVVLGDDTARPIP